MPNQNKSVTVPTRVVFILAIITLALIVGLGVFVTYNFNRKGTGSSSVKDTGNNGASYATSTSKTDPRSFFVDNYKQRHLSHDGMYLRISTLGDGPERYGLDDLTQGLAHGFAPQIVQSSVVEAWIDLSKHSLPVDRIVNAVWDGNDLVAYQTLDGAYLYDLKTIQTQALDAGEKLKIGGGCRPSFSKFSPSRRFMIIDSMGETEACTIYGLFDLKNNKLIEMPGVYTVMAGQSYAFEPTPQNGGEYRVFYLDDWRLNEKPDDALNFPEPHAVSVLNADNGKSKILYTGDVAGFEVRYEYPNLVLIPEGRGAKEIVIKIDENDLP